MKKLLIFLAFLSLVPAGVVAADDNCSNSCDIVAAVENSVMGCLDIIPDLKIPDVNKKTFVDCLARILPFFIQDSGKYYFDNSELARKYFGIYYRKVLGGLPTETMIPKLPAVTQHRADWTKMLLYWFFEIGDEYAYFPSDSPESIDIANSYSMKYLREKYRQDGQIPSEWIFSGPETCLGIYGEVEWFIGSYAIRNFKLENGIATFEVVNASTWHSGTRLPITWQENIKNKTDKHVSEFIESSQRGMFWQDKIAKNYPQLLKYRCLAKLIGKLPSFGGNWYQTYAIEIEW